MKIDVYDTQLSPKPGVLVSLMVKAGTNVTGLPQDLLQKLGNLTFTKSIIVEPDFKGIGADSGDVILKNIEEQDWHLQETVTSITISQ